ncbi:unnamed protein product [Cuscuta campestris]|uniref:Uncharacterized protein n=1 Tax=Cuscuta campestris TaxID=132261 RepID=A0A484LMH0_9ASTE|nr:unnamed protein product [Cuscuta campestris]
MVQSFPSEKLNLRNLKFVPVKGEKLLTDISFPYCPVSLFEGEFSIDPTVGVIGQGSILETYSESSLSLSSKGVNFELSIKGKAVETSTSTQKRARSGLEKLRGFSSTLSGLPNEDAITARAL